MNAKKELLKHIESREVEYILVKYYENYEDTKEYKGNLSDVIDLLDFNYYSGFGRQELDGLIWYTDGSWSERGEYDGSEWWTHKKRPEINEFIL